MQTKKAVLLPCPFCGSPAEIWRHGEYWVRCTRLGVCYGGTLKGSENGFTFEADAVELWNRRASSPENGRHAAPELEAVAWRYRRYDTEEKAHSDIWNLTSSREEMEVHKHYGAVVEPLYAAQAPVVPPTDDYIAKQALSLLADNTEKYPGLCKTPFGAEIGPFAVSLVRALLAAHPKNDSVHVAEKTLVAASDSGKPESLGAIERQDAALQMAQFFHESYERLAPRFNYETRPGTKEFKPNSRNGLLMQAVCAEWLAKESGNG
jgi:hypothetical protein